MISQWISPTLMLFGFAFAGELTVTPQESGCKVSLRGLYAFSSSYAWASGAEGTWLFTDDAGAHWQRGTVPGAEKRDFRDVHILAKDTVLLQSVGSGGDSQIFKTTDGGKNWSTVYTNPHPSGFFDGIAFFNDNRGISYSDPVDGQFFLLATQDAGETWSRIPNLPPAIKDEASFAASGTGLHLLSSGHVWFGTGGGGVARVFHSPDWGKTWGVAETPLRRDVPGSGVFSVLFWDAKNGCIVGGAYEKLEDTQGVCAVSNDGGKTWSLSAKPPAGYRSAVALVPGSGQLLLAAGPAGMDTSKDGGKTWSPVKSEGYHSISFAAGSSSGWVSGFDGRIARVVRHP